MINRRFLAMDPPPADHPAAIQLEAAYPGFRRQRVLRQIKALVSELAYGPIWAGRLLTWDQYRQTQWPADHLAALAQVTEPVIPAYSAELSQRIRDGSPFAMIDLCRWICQALEVLAALPAPANTVPRKQDTAIDYDQWLAGSDYPRKDAVNALLRHVRQSAPPMVRAVLLHGSAADGNVVDGFSDIDAYFILNTPATADQLLQTVQWLLQINHYLLAFNPCAHHGPMLVLAQELTHCSHALFPAAVVDRGVWAHGTPPAIFDSPSLYDSIAAFAPFEHFYEQQATRPADIHSAFDLLWWTSSGLLLPVLINQLVERRSVWKRDCLTNPGLWLPDAFRPVVAELSQVRLRLGEWIAARLPAEPWPAGGAGDLLAGVGLTYYKQVLSLSDADRAALGLHADLMLSVRMMWEYSAATALETHRGELGRAGPGGVSRFISWPHELTERPFIATIQTYDTARERYIARAQTVPGVLALYEFGNIGCPGLSDLDLLVVLDDAMQGIPEALTADAQPDAVRSVLVHDPLFVSRSSAALLGAVFPIFSLTHLWGEALDIPLTAHFSPTVRAAMYTCSTSTKYPDDLIWLTKEPLTKWSRVLAYAHSFNHVATCLKDMGIDVPPGVIDCADFSRVLRHRFTESATATTADLQTAAPIALRAAADGIAALELHWRRQLNPPSSAIAPFDPDQYRQSVLASRESDPNIFPPRPPALTIVRAFCMGGTTSAANSLATPLQQRAGEYVRLKSQFLTMETKQGRHVSRYIHEPDRAEG